MNPSDESPARATAVFSDAFQLPGLEADPRTPEMIERDRVIMAARPGMLRKLLPLRVDERGVTCGGVYLFDTYENAVAYGDWVAHDFVLDGTLFLDRPVFIEPTSQVWHLVGVEDFADVRTDQHVMRFERWHTMDPADIDMLRERHWPGIRDTARQAGLSSAWLLYCPDEHHPQVGLVTVASHGGRTPTGTAEEDLARLESLPSLGAGLAEKLGATKVFDRTSWVYQVWFPLRAAGADYDGSSLWPNSPPLPGPNSSPR